MKISKRLKSLAGLITLDDKVADIGCDHALLDIYMVKNNITETEETQETEETETETEETEETQETEERENKDEN